MSYLFLLYTPLTLLSSLFSCECLRTHTAFRLGSFTRLIPRSLSWVDTAASTVGRLYGPRTSRLPRSIWGIPVPFASRKSVAGFLAGSLTGACIAIGFWGWIAPLGYAKPSWTWPAELLRSQSSAVLPALGSTARGWAELGLLGLVTGLVSGVSEALGALNLLVCHSRC